MTNNTQDIIKLPSLDMHVNLSDGNCVLHEDGVNP